MCLGAGSPVISSKALWKDTKALMRSRDMLMERADAFPLAAAFPTAELASVKQDWLIVSQ
jgi:hypothetical protein